VSLFCQKDRVWSRPVIEQALFRLSQGRERELSIRIGSLAREKGEGPVWGGGKGEAIGKKDSMWWGFASHRRDNRPYTSGHNGEGNTLEGDTYGIGFNLLNDGEVITGKMRAKSGGREEEAALSSSRREHKYHDDRHIVPGTALRLSCRVRADQTGRKKISRRERPSLFRKRSNESGRVKRLFSIHWGRIRTSSLTEGNLVQRFSLENVKRHSLNSRCKRGKTNRKWGKGFIDKVKSRYLFREGRNNAQGGRKVSGQTGRKLMLCE